VTSNVTPGGTPGGVPEVVDLRGQPSPEQMQQVQALLERAAEQAITLLTDLEVVPKFLLPAAAERGLRCRLEPPKDGEWRLTLRPKAAAAETSGGLKDAPEAQVNEGGS